MKFHPGLWAHGLQLEKGIIPVLENHELVKNALADYSTEHFEIACCRALIAGAQALGETEVVRVCDGTTRF